MEIEGPGPWALCLAFWVFSLVFREGSGLPEAHICISLCLLALHPGWPSPSGIRRGPALPPGTSCLGGSGGRPTPSFLSLPENQLSNLRLCQPCFPDQHLGLDRVSVARLSGVSQVLQIPWPFPRSEPDPAFLSLCWSWL